MVETLNLVCVSRLAYALEIGEIVSYNLILLPSRQKNPVAIVEPKLKSFIIGKRNVIPTRLSYALGITFQLRIL